MCARSSRRNVLEPGHPLHQCDGLQLDLGNVMALQTAQLVSNGRCQAFRYRLGKCAMHGLLCDGFSLDTEQQALRQPFLHIVDQVWKVLGNLIQGMLRRLVPVLILVT